MPRYYTQTFGAAAGLLERDGKFLLVKEGEGPDKGKWHHPAGWLDVGEHPMIATKREVFEETGMDFTPTALLGIYSLVRPQGNDRIHPLKFVFIGSFVETDSKAWQGEISELGWFAPAEIYAMDVDTLRDEDIKQMVKDYLAGKRFPLDAIIHTVL